MPIPVHILAVTIGQAIGFAAGLFLYYGLHLNVWFAATVLPHLSGGTAKLAGIVPPAVAAVAGVLGMSRWCLKLPARCPRSGCGGRASCFSATPYSYRCNDCGNVYVASMSAGGKR